MRFISSRTQVVTKQKRERMQQQELHKMELKMTFDDYFLRTLILKYIKLGNKLKKIYMGRAGEQERTVYVLVQRQ